MCGLWHDLQIPGTRSRSRTEESTDISDLEAEYQLDRLWYEVICLRQLPFNDGLDELMVVDGDAGRAHDTLQLDAGLKCHTVRMQ